MLSFACIVLGACGGGLSESGAVTQGIAVQGDNLQATGTDGGPFAPTSASYQILNLDEEPTEWSVSVDQPWLVAQPASGVLDALQSTTVTVAIGAGAAALPPGTHGGTITFSNLTSSVGETTRFVALTVVPTGSVPMTAALRTTGVAPLAVTFDAVGAASGVTQPAGPDPDYPSYTYQWDYGDPASGSWPHSGKSRNQSVGFIGGHVYEVPGTYRARLTVVDDQGTAFHYHQDIVVTDPEQVYAGRTFYVAANGNNSSQGTLAQPFATLARGLTAAQAANGPSRIRMRRGDLFVHSDNLSIGGVTGPTELSAYGVGAAPVLEFRGANGGLSVTGTNDLRVVDISLVANSTSLLAWAPGVDVGNRTLLLRCVLQGFGYGISLTETDNPTVAECEVLDSNQYGMYSYGSNGRGDHLCLLGNRWNGGALGLLRTYASRSVWMSNAFQGPIGPNAVRLMGRQAPAKSEFMTVADNAFDSTATNVLEISPENSTSNQLVENVLVEGNRFRCRTPTSTCVNVSGRRVVIRNNIFDVDDCMAVGVNRKGIEPPPIHVRVDNNTAFRAQGSTLHFLVAINAETVQIRNNILYCPNGTVSLPSSGVSAITNLTQDPQFEDFANGDLRLRATSPAVDSGTEIANRVDFARLERAVGSPIDIGAFERQ